MNTIQKAISEFKEKLIRLIDENLIGYNQFNSIGEMSRMVEVKELKERIEKTAQEILG